MESVKIKISDIKGKKYMALFFKGDKQYKKVHFGQEGASDYTKHKDEERKNRYLARHEKNEDWENPYTPGALSRWILWNKPTLRSSIDDFKKRFGFI